MVGRIVLVVLLGQHVLWKIEQGVVAHPLFRIAQLFYRQYHGHSARNDLVDVGDFFREEALIFQRCNFYRFPHHANAHDGF
jgi:hypothetical protein